MDFQKERNIVVVYHNCCIDGLASAWAVEQKLKQESHAKIHYIPYDHHNSAAAEREILARTGQDAEFIFVDTAPEKQLLDQMMLPDAKGKARALSINIMDHHKTAGENLSGYVPPAVSGFTTPPALSINIDRDCPAASLLVWNRLMPDTEVPDFLQMIAKMDLDQNLHTAEDFSAAALIDAQDLSSVSKAFYAFGMLSALTYKEMATLGDTIHSDHMNKIGKLASDVMYTCLKIADDLPQMCIPVINADVQHFGRQVSEYLRRLGKEAETDVAFAWHVQGNGAVTVSIRSDGTPDASAIARHFNERCGTRGGGHETSAAVHFSSLHEFCAHLELHPGKEAEPAVNPVLRNNRNGRSAPRPHRRHF